VRRSTLFDPMMRSSF